MLDLKEERRIFFDLETTDKYFRSAKITEVFGVELVNDLPTGRVFYHLLDPVAPLSDAVEKKTRLTNDFLRGRSVIKNVYPRWATFLGDGDASKATDVVLGGHNIDRYDIEILNRRHKEHYGHQLRDDKYLAYATEERETYVRTGSTIDTLSLVHERKLFPHPFAHSHYGKSKFPKLEEAAEKLKLDTHGIPAHCAAGDVPVSLCLYYLDKYGPDDSHSDDENVFRKKLVKFLCEQAKSVSEPFFRCGAKEPLGYNRDNGSSVYTVSLKACLDKDIADALADLSKYSNWRGRASYTRKILHQVKMLREDAGRVSERQPVSPPPFATALHAKSSLISREDTPEDAYGTITASDEEAFAAVVKQVEESREKAPALIRSDAQYTKSALISRENTPEDAYGTITASDEEAFAAVAQQVEKSREKARVLVRSDVPEKRKIFDGLDETTANVKRHKVDKSMPRAENREGNTRGL